MKSFLSQKVGAQAASFLASHDVRVSPPLSLFFFVLFFFVRGKTQHHVTNTICHHHLQAARTKRRQRRERIMRCKGKMGGERDSSSFL